MPASVTTTQSRRMADIDGFAATSFATVPDTAPNIPTAPGPEQTRAQLRRHGRWLIGSLLLAQSLFVLYLLATFGRTVIARNVAAWSQLSAKGWVAGDQAGNTAMVLHLAFAVLILSLGAIQLSQRVRQRAPALHRWSGRLYLGGCYIAAISGLWLVWVRGTVGDRLQHIAITINALLLFVCAIMAWRTARGRRFAEHRTWALRAFLVGNGVLYFRMFLALWLLVFRAPVGFTPSTFSGPFLTTLAFTVYVFGPLSLLEAYRWAERSTSGTRHRVLSGVMIGVALLLVCGAFAAVLVLWMPRMLRVWH